MRASAPDPFVRALVVRGQSAEAERDPLTAELYFGLAAIRGSLEATAAITRLRAPRARARLRWSNVWVRDVESLAFSPDGRDLFVGARGALLRFDVQRLSLVDALEATVASVAADGRTAVTLRADRGFGPPARIDAWRLPSFERVGRSTADGDGRDLWPRLSADGRLLFLVGNPTRVFALPSLHLVSEFANPAGPWIIPSPTGDRVAAQAYQAFYLLRSDGLRLRGSPEPASSDRRVSFSSDGHHLAFVESRPTRSPGSRFDDGWADEVLVTDPVSGAVHTRIPLPGRRRDNADGYSPARHVRGTPRDEVTSMVAFGPADRLLAVARGVQPVLVLSTDGRVQAKLDNQREHVIRMAFSPDGALIAGATFEGGIFLWSTLGGVGARLGGCVSDSVERTPDEREGLVRIVHAGGDRCPLDLQTGRVAGPIARRTFRVRVPLPGERSELGTDVPGRLQRYDALTGQFIRDEAAPGLEGLLDAWEISAHRWPRALLSPRQGMATGQQGLVIWNAAAGSHVRLPGVVRQALFIGGRQVLTTSTDGWLRVWDADTGALLRGQRVPQHDIYALSLAEAAGRIAVLGEGGAHVLDLVRGSRISAIGTKTADPRRCGSSDAATLKPGFIALHPSGRQLAASYSDGVRIWDVASGQLVLTLPFRDEVMRIDYVDQGRGLLVQRSGLPSLERWDIDLQGAGRSSLAPAAMIERAAHESGLAIRSTAEAREELADRRSALCGQVDIFDVLFRRRPHGGVAAPPRNLDVETVPASALEPQPCQR